MGFGSRRAFLTAATAGLSSLAGCSGFRRRIAGDATIEAVSPALRDVPPDIRVLGLDPNAEVRLTAATRTRFTSWRSWALFEADSEGVVRVADVAPLDGTYSGVDGAGLLWSMEPDGEGVQPWPNESYSVELTVSHGDSILAETTLERRRSDPTVTSRWVSDDTVVGRYARPPVESPRPGILVLHGSSGTPLVHVAELVASHGFPALALKYFGTEGGLQPHLKEIPRSYFDEAADWLRSRSSVRDGPLGVYGFSRGGEAALFLASYADWVGAVVGDVPSGIAWQAVRRDGGKASGSAWAIDGDPLPFVSYEGCAPTYTESGHRRDAAFYECGLARADPSTVAEATFPLERFDGPILCLSGGQDAVWPSTRLTGLAADRLRDRGSTERFTHRAYDEAGHVIPIPYVPTTGIPTTGKRVIGGTPRGIATAAADAWPQMLETFGQL